ncbi:hypothetical protein EZJ58_3518 [Sodalis ligni]|uniref:Uncharacterized protein n=1 Tax=Sodalis ligni TaxID=2697027 RepID=A0A4R1ND43_9GAMM|nr:hypothetical protein EZJ58_3518 [Sodalis ligni]
MAPRSDKADSDSKYGRMALLRDITLSECGRVSVFLRYPTVQGYWITCGLTQFRSTLPVRAVIRFSTAVAAMS